MPTSAASTAVSMVESTAEAAFASDEQGRIVAWNRAAEVLFGVSGDQALGRPCHEMFSGLDVFGNLYCRADCAPREMACRREPVRSFTLDVRRASGEVTRIDIRIVSRMKSFQRSHKSSRIPAPVAERLRKLGYTASH